MRETSLEKVMRPIPVPFEEFEEWPIQMQEFFDLIARRPYELLETKPRLFGREFESFFKPEAELFRPVFLKLFEAEEALVVRAEVPGYTEKELNITCEPWKVTITGKKEYKEEYKEEYKAEKKELAPVHKEKMQQIYKTVKLPIAIRPDAVKATLKNGILELTLPKAEVVKKVHIEVKQL